MQSVLHPDDMPGYLAAVRKAVRQHGRLQCRVRVERKGGEWRSFETNALPWFTSEGEYAGHAGISNDYTDIVQTMQLCAGQFDPPTLP